MDDPTAQPQSAPIYPVAGQPTRSTAPTNQLAVWAMVLGIVGFCCAGFYGIGIPMAIAAIIMGAIAMKQTKERGENGHGMAIAGLVLGIVGVVFAVIGILFLGALLVASLGFMDEYCAEFPDDPDCQGFAMDGGNNDINWMMKTLRAELRPQPVAPIAA